MPREALPAARGVDDGRREGLARAVRWIGNRLRCAPYLRP